MIKMLLRNSIGTAFFLCAALLATLAGCASHDAENYDDPLVQMQPGYVEHDDYLYFPRAQIYYGIHSRRYFYQEGDQWVSRQAPRSRSISSVLNSPSVKMTFHDQPAPHHGVVSRMYPKDWLPPMEQPAIK